VTPLDALLGSHASAILVLSVVAVLLLAAAAAVLDFMSGAFRVLSPVAFEGPRTGALVTVGLPAAFALLAGAGTLGAVVSGTAEPGKGTEALLWLTNVAFVLSVLVCGLCSPMARHWGLGLAGFAAGLGVIFALLRLISSLGFDSSGLLTSAPDRLVFGVTTGGIMLAAALAGAALVAMIAYVAERTVLLLRHRLPLPDRAGQERFLPRGRAQ
jgi:hypothetical protein